MVIKCLLLNETNKTARSQTKPGYSKSLHYLSYRQLHAIRFNIIMCYNFLIFIYTKSASLDFTVQFIQKLHSRCSYKISLRHLFTEVQ